MVVILFLVVLSFSNTNNEESINLDLFFYNNCTDEIEPIEFYKIGKMNSGEFAFYSNGPRSEIKSTGKYLISAEFLFDNQVSFFSDTIRVESLSENIVDTFHIPKVKEYFRSGNMQKGKFFVCNVLCEGEVIDYYPNGQKKILGNFVEGNPIELIRFAEDGNRKKKEVFKEGKQIELIEYRKNGKKSKHFYFSEDGKTLKIIEFFDEDGFLNEYTVYTYRLYSFKAKTYNAKGDLIAKKVMGYH